MFLWRISKFADLSGKGGELVSGRWHDKGHPIVYCADHPSTALLEMIVHMNPVNIPESYQLLKIECPDELWRTDEVQFSPREQDMREMLGHGITEQQISAMLGVSDATVHGFLEGTLSKIETQSGIQADEFRQRVLNLRIQDRNYTARFGTDWLESMRSCILKVPSAVMPEATNYLLNPSHPDAGKIKIVSVFEYLFDQRLR
jgi:RES domain-containing protein